MKLKNKYEYNNKIAKKFRLIIDVIHYVGYIVSGILLIIGFLNSMPFDIFGKNLLSNLSFPVIVALSTWFSTLFLEAIAEIIELLDSIKNKLN